MSSEELKRDDEEIYSMKANLSELAELAALDPETGELSNIKRSEFNPKAMQSVVLVRKDFVIPLDKLKQNKGA